jgi:signal transduction histidine kinase
MTRARGISLGIAMVVAVALVLVFAVRNLELEHAHLFEGFTATQLASARATASSLEDRLKSIIEDAHVVATLAERARGRDAEPELLTAFDAMTNVVRHYRSLALFSADGRLLVSAVDESEAPASAAALLKVSETSAGQARRDARLSGPFEVARGRRLYVYAFPVRGGTVAVTIDAPVFLRFRASPGAQIVVVGPDGSAWLGCSTAHACAPQRDVLSPQTGAGGDVAWLDAKAAERVGLPGAIAVAAWRSVEQPSLGAWRVAVIASAASLRDQERALERELVLTAGGLLGTIGIIGALIVRQQRHAAALAERLRHAETLRVLEGQLIRAEKLATTGVLAAGIAHEVGTPLGIIRARAELLHDDVLSESGRRAVGTIIGQIDQISSTIREVLDFSREQAVELRSVSPEHALGTVTNLLEHRFMQQKIRAHVDVEAGLPDVAADPNQLQQVLVNLVMNACDALPEGGEIWLTARRDDGGACVAWELRDNGSGIAAENLLAVFDPFFTTKKRGEGTGLGLPVAASIVRNHGGELSLASALGQGTIVSIRWPVAKGEAFAQG